jgi:hypothetical protein
LLKYSGFKRILELKKVNAGALCFGFFCLIFVRKLLYTEPMHCSGAAAGAQLKEMFYEQFLPYYPPQAYKLGRYSLILLIFLVLGACSNPSGSGNTAQGSETPATTPYIPHPPAPPAAPVITGVSFTGITAMAVDIDSAARTVTVWVPSSTTALNSLAPTITHNGASISPAGAQDFTNPVVYTVTGNGASAAWTVTVKKLTPQTTVTGIGTYLSSYPGSTIPLEVSLNLADTGGNGWADLLGQISDSAKPVALDLTACTMSGTDFDPGIAGTGESNIVSLVLPSAAVSVKAGSSSNPTFENFTALTSVTGGTNLATIGNYAFSNCADLTTASVPAAATIGEGAFFDCAALTTASFPAATAIGEGAFAWCTVLTTASFPYFLVQAFYSPKASSSSSTIGTGTGSAGSGSRLSSGGRGLAAASLSGLSIPFSCAAAGSAGAGGATGSAASISLFISAAWRLGFLLVFLGLRFVRLVLWLVWLGLRVGFHFGRLGLRRPGRWLHRLGLRLGRLGCRVV